MFNIRFYITSLGNGGAEKVLLNLLKQMDYSKYRVSLITLYRGEHFDEAPEFVNKKSIFKKPSFLSKVMSKIPAKLFTLLLLRGNNDCEVAYLEGRPARIVAKKRTKGRRLAFVHCDISVKEPLRKIYKSKIECLKEYQSFDNVCFVSEDCKNGFENCIGTLNNAVVVHNVQDYLEMDKLSHEDCDDYQTHGLKILTVGRLFPQKGLERLIDVASKLEKNLVLRCLLLEMALKWKG